jgi:ribosomal protein L37AE/L43A
MSLQAIQAGIQAIQTGDMVRGEQLLRTGLQSPEVTGSARAVGYMWLATTSNNPHFQIECYQAAVQADPANTEARNRLNALIQAQQPPPPVNLPMPPANPPPQAPPPPQSMPQATQSFQAHGQNQAIPRMWEFGVQGGPNGIGTAFLIVRDGLLATTRYIVGSMTNVILISRDGKRMDGQVVRSYPEFDLALIRSPLNVPYLRDMTPSIVVPPNMRLIADDYTERTVEARCRATRRQVTPGWFPTTFTDELPRSFNGAPLIDEKDDLVGMLTRNADRNTGNFYGLHVSTIRRKIEEYYAEIQTDPNRLYCGTCGSLSRAGADGLYYCDICGTTLPFAQNQRRRPHPRAHLYYDSDLR